MIISISATKDQAAEEYIWMEYDNARGREVSQRTHQRKITKGTVYGIKSLRGGARFTLIFPDLLHINFPLSKQEGNFLLDRSKKLNSVPDLADRSGRKTNGVQSSRRQQLKRDFSAPRFVPNAVPSELSNGIDLENYQWRFIPSQLKVVHTKGREVFARGELIGLRFLQPSKGGILVNREGLFLKLSTEEYDAVVQNTDLLPIQEWPNGYIDSESMKLFKRDRVRAAKIALRDTSEAQRLQNKANKLAQRLADKEQRQEDRQRDQAETERLASVRQKLKTGQLQAPERPILEPLPESIVKDKTTMNERLLSDDDLLREESEDLMEEVKDFQNSGRDLIFTMDDDSVENPAEYDLMNILSVRPVSAAQFDLQTVFDALFSDKRPEDQETGASPEFDLSNLDGDDQDEGEDQDGDSEDEENDLDGDSEEDDLDADDEDQDDEEDDLDADDEDSDDDEEDDSDDEEDDADGDVEDEDGEEDAGGDGDGDDADEEGAGSDDSGQDEEGDSDDGSADDGGDGSDADDSEDGDDPDAAAKDKAKKVAVRYAANNQNVPRGSSKSPEEGDVLVFNNDKKLQREFVILNVSTHESSDNIVVYRLYNMTDAPDHVSIVRINRARGQSLLDQAHHVKDLKPAVFNRVYDLAEDMDVDKSPIIS